MSQKNLERARNYYQKPGFSVRFDFSDNRMVAIKVGSQEQAIILKDIKNFQTLRSLFGLRLMTCAWSKRT